MNYVNGFILFNVQDQVLKIYLDKYHFLVAG